MNDFIPKQIEQYLVKKAEKKWLIQNREKHFRTVVVVPVIKELDNIPKLLSSLSKNETSAIKSTLILFVVNNSDENEKEVIEENILTIEFLRKLKSEPNQYGLNIDFVDAASENKYLPAKYAGVGLARKIGMDQALYYFDYSKKGNAIVCLDADCEVDANYLTEIQKYYDGNNHTAVIKYEHKLDNEAIINYEIFLRYYVLGLKLAKSPYAYHSIGSCITVSPIAYAKIGGMNKKKAGEDFYFLEKAAKLEDIKSINTTTVYPSSRKSWRVPFGTGQRITRYHKKVRDEYVLYNADSFVVLKEFLNVYRNERTNDPNEILNTIKTISKDLYEFLINNQFESALNKINENAATVEQLQHQKKIWFDAFKTLKLIHYLRDNEYPEEPMFTTLNRIFDLFGITDFDKYLFHDVPPVKKQIEYLDLLRKLT